MKIEGTVALVTGANRGLGHALVEALLEGGAAKVYAAARDPEKLAGKDPRVVPLALDLTNPESIAKAADAAKDVALLVNNAGILTAYSVLTTSPKDLDADFRTNVLGSLAVTRAFVPALARAAHGTIVNILSLGSLAPIPSLGGYCATKAAGYSVTLALRAELKPKGVSVLAALPGLIDTDMVRQIPAPKTNPAVTAKGILEGIARGDEEIFPDPGAVQFGALWKANHKELERTFAGF